MGRVFKSLTGARSYKPWKEWEVGDYMIGEFVDVVTDNYGKPNYVLEIEECEFADGSDYKPGTRFGLNHNGILAHVMESDRVDIGDTIRVEYQGTSTLPENHKYKGRESHQLLVEVASESEDDAGEEGSLSDDDGDI